MLRDFEWILQGTTFASDVIVFPILLGDLWIKTLGGMNMDYFEFTIGFNYLGKHHLFKGVFMEYKLSDQRS